MKLTESELKKLILQVISEQEDEDGEEKPESKKKPAPEPSDTETTKKLKIDIPDSPFDDKSEKDVNEGPSYEYANYMKKIEKAENNQAKEVNNFVKLLMKKGLKKEATAIASKYVRGVAEFDNFLKKIYGRLA
jgi:hypothetical protein